MAQIERHIHRHLVAADGGGDIGQRLAVQRHLHAYLYRVGGAAPEGDRHAERATIEIRGPADVRDVGGVDSLEPYRLPDTGGAMIPARVRMGLPVLLAAGHGQVERRILGADYHGRRTVVQRGGDVRVEGGVPALVRGDEPAIHPYPGTVVDGAAMQDRSLTGAEQRPLESCADTTPSGGRRCHRCRWRATQGGMVPLSGARTHPRAPASARRGRGRRRRRRSPRCRTGRPRPHARVAGADAPGYARSTRRPPGPASSVPPAMGDAGRAATASGARAPTVLWRTTSSNACSKRWGGRCGHR